MSEEQVIYGDKQKLYIDFDNTIINTIEAFCKVYNEKYKHHSDFKPAKWWEVEKYDFSDQCPLLDSCHSIFDDKRFFEVCEFINGGYTLNVLKQLSEEYHIVIATIGTPKNLANKALWLEENLPFIKDYILLHNGENIMDKSMVNMQGGVFIDDVYSNLSSSNASVKICFGDVYEWNKEFDSVVDDVRRFRCMNWADVRNRLI